MGTQRCPVEVDRTDFASSAACRRSRSAVARYAGCTQWHFMGVGHGSAVARTASEISAIPDLPPPLSALGASGQAGARFADAGGRVTSPRKTRPRGGIHRRHFRGGKKGGLAVGPTKRGKGTKILVLADDHSLPLAVSIESASPHESQLVEGLLGHSFLDALPARMIGDRAYDSDRLDRDLAERYGIEMIAPHRGVHRKPTQDGRPLRRYCRRWRVERLFAWLHHFRRLVVRWEYHVENFFGMVRLGCMQILLRYV
jgi:transposase